MTTLGILGAPRVPDEGPGFLFRGKLLEPGGGKPVHLLSAFVPGTERTVTPFPLPGPARPPRCVVSSRRPALPHARRPTSTARRSSDSKQTSIPGSSEKQGWRPLPRRRGSLTRSGRPRPCGPSSRRRTCPACRCCSARLPRRLSAPRPGVGSSLTPGDPPASSLSASRRHRRDQTSGGDAER